MEVLIDILVDTLDQTDKSANTKLIETLRDKVIDDISEPGNQSDYDSEEEQVPKKKAQLKRIQKGPSFGE